MTLKVNVDINPEELRAHLVQTIANSVIGEEIKRAIENIFESRSHSGAGLIQGAVTNAVRTHVYRIVNEHLDERKDAIRAIVAEQATDEAVGKIARAMFDRAMRGVEL
jgi:hypothetical protein